MSSEIIEPGRKSKAAYLAEASAKELLGELERRRKMALEFCSNEDIEEELAKRPGYDGGYPLPERHPDKIVRK